MAKRVSAAELRKKKPDDLRRMLGELNREHWNLRVQQGLKRLARPSDKRAVRRNIARILTVMRQNERKGGTA